MSFAILRISFPFLPERKWILRHRSRLSQTDKSVGSVQLKSICDVPAQEYRLKLKPHPARIVTAAQLQGRICQRRPPGFSCRIKFMKGKQHFSRILHCGRKNLDVVQNSLTRTLKSLSRKMIRGIGTEVADPQCRVVLSLGDNGPCVAGRVGSKVFHIVHFDSATSKER